MWGQKCQLGLIIKLQRQNKTLNLEDNVSSLYRPAPGYKHPHQQSFIKPKRSLHFLNIEYTDCTKAQIPTWLYHCQPPWTELPASMQDNQKHQLWEDVERWCLQRSASQRPGSAQLSHSSCHIAVESLSHCTGVTTAHCTGVSVKLHWCNTLLVIQ